MQTTTPEEDDVAIACNAAIAVITIFILGSALLIIVPDLFNRHSTEADLGALVLAGGAIAFAFLVGRHLWRSITSPLDGDKE
jgi:hypothetical protein